MKERKLTIFTPIYNRAYCLNNCYQSMRRQKNKRFIWIIVDDGSTDNLESLVSEWIVDESEFQIEYYRKENGGMYTAYNLAFEHIITDYWMCIDSDDWLADDAVDRIYDAIDYVEKKKLSICGIVGLDALQDGTICGGKLPDVDIVGLLELKLKYHHKIQLDEAENTPEGEAVPGQMACRAGKSSFVVNWQGEMRSCVVLDKPSIPLRDVEFEKAWELTKKGTESLRISARCSSCKLRKVCNTCVAAAIAETGKADGVPEYLCRYTEATVRYLKETSKK